MNKAVVIFALFIFIPRQTFSQDTRLDDLFREIQRNVVTIQTSFDSGNGKIDNHGKAFIFFKEGDSIYLLTAAHVLFPPIPFHGDYSLIIRKNDNPLASYSLEETVKGLLAYSPDALTFKTNDYSYPRVNYDISISGRDITILKLRLSPAKCDSFSPMNILLDEPEDFQSLEAFSAILHGSTFYPYYQGEGQEEDYRPCKIRYIKRTNSFESKVDYPVIKGDSGSPVFKVVQSPGCAPSLCLYGVISTIPGASTAQSQIAYFGVLQNIEENAIAALSSVNNAYSTPYRTYTLLKSLYKLQHPDTFISAGSPLGNPADLSSAWEPSYHCLWPRVYFSFKTIFFSSKVTKSLPGDTGAEIKKLSKRLEYNAISKHLLAQLLGYDSLEISYIEELSPERKKLVESSAANISKWRDEYGLAGMSIDAEPKEFKLRLSDEITLKDYKKRLVEDLANSISKGDIK